MADIEQDLLNIEKAVFGKDVRGSIHDAIRDINEEVEAIQPVTVVQSTGQSTENVMSQKAVTDALEAKADLDANGRIPYSQLPESAMEFKGDWNANTNTPTLVNGTGDIGDFYIVSVAGESLGQIFKVNDRVIFNQNNVWVKLSGGEVTSVNGKTGPVTLDSDDISDTNKTHKFVTSEQIDSWNNKSNFSGSYNDLSNKPDIPSRLSQLNDDSTHRLVTDEQIQAWDDGTEVEVRQVLQSGTKIATISVDGDDIDIYAPAGGGGGGSGDMLASTYDPQGEVATEGGIPAYVTAQITSAITNAIGGSY